MWPPSSQTATRAEKAGYVLAVLCVLGFMASVASRALGWDEQWTTAMLAAALAAMPIAMLLSKGCLACALLGACQWFGRSVAQARQHNASTASTTDAGQN